MKLVICVAYICLVCFCDCGSVPPKDESAVWDNQVADDVEMTPEEDEELYKRFSTTQTRKIAFMAYSKKHYHEVHHHTYNVMFENVRVNLGYGYSVHSGHFTAPVKGLYMIVVKLASEWNPPNKKYRVWAELMHNSRPVTGLSSAHDGMDSASQTDVMILNAGDQVWVKLVPGAGSRLLTANGYYHSFGGVLLYSL